MNAHTRKRVLAALLLAGGSLTTAAQDGEWIGCANRTHSLDVLIDPVQKQVLGFGLTIHGAKQDRISWDIVKGVVDPGTQSLTFIARERSTAPREISLEARESTGRFSLRGTGPEQKQDLSCFWGSIGL